MGRVEPIKVYVEFYVLLHNPPYKKIIKELSARCPFVTRIGWSERQRLGRMQDWQINI